MALRVLVFVRLREPGEEVAGLRERNLAGEVEALAVGRLRGLVRRAMRDDAALRALVEGVQRREVDPLTAVGAVVESVRDGEPS